MLVVKTNEKVTFNLPSDLKDELAKLKETLNVSFNTLYKTAISEYIQRQEVKRWEQAAIKASQNKEYKELTKDLANMGGDFYEY